MCLYFHSPASSVQCSSLLWIWLFSQQNWGFPGVSDDTEDGFDPRVGKSPWRRQSQPTPVLLPGEFHGRRSLVGYNPWGCRVGHDWATNTITTCWVHTSELTHVNPIRCILASPSTYKQGNWDTKRLNKLPMGTKLATGSMENQSSEAPGPHLWKKNIACHSSSGEGNGTPLQYSCLANPMDGGA